MVCCSRPSELLGLLTLAGLLAACEQHALGRGGPKPNAGSPGAYDAGDDTCPATCSTPPGNIVPWGAANSDERLRAGIVGVWQICFGAYSIFHWAPSDTIGVEFAPAAPIDAAWPEANMFFLIAGPSGPVRGAGFEYEQTYVLSGAYLYCHDSYNSGDGWRIKYSPCPREWQIEYDYTGPLEKATLVPF
jgi:hypothetical protein